jgi:nucleotide-binding universal stress UspA family protein
MAGKIAKGSHTMRVLLAIDGSESARRATELVHNINWPTGTTIQVLSVVQSPINPMMSMPGLVPAPDGIEELAAAAYSEASRVVGDASAILRVNGRTLQPTVVVGRPATVIVEQAGRFRPDLVVLGSRGRGPVAATVLGSVSTEVAELATWPVLIARSPSISRVVFADDGSLDAGAARQLLQTMPGFKGLPVRVVSVQELTSSWYGWIEPVAADVMQGFEEALVRDRQRYAAVATRTAELLRGAGLAAEADVREGEAGHEIIESARAFGADLIVTGTRGQTGLERVLLGSIARKVVQRATCSVLVVHPPIHTDDHRQHIGS